MTTFIFIRHAHSLGNQMGFCSGHMDYPLVEKGHAQAKRLAEHLRATYPIDAIYASNLIRTIQTAQPTAEAFGLEVQMDPRFCEVCLGEWEGQTWKAVEEQDPELSNSWLSMRMRRSDRRPRGSECMEEVWERVGAAVKEIVADHRGSCVAVFCHGRMMRAFSTLWAEQDADAAQILADKAPRGFFGASITVAEFNDDGSFAKLLLCNDREYMMDKDARVAVE
ncbi:MAG: histidine phosphatase family protein [Clostridia bacterium]|nr:histidine phosphatase family protein [Clostridia bacterium]